MGNPAQPRSAAERAGRGLARLLRGLFGDRFLSKAADSARVLRDEYRAGREAAEGAPDETRRIAHREVGDEPERDVSGQAGPPRDPEAP